MNPNGREDPGKKKGKGAHRAPERPPQEATAPQGHAGTGNIARTAQGEVTHAPATG